jgi:hypothetical protein
MFVCSHQGSISITNEALSGSHGGRGGAATPAATAAAATAADGTAESRGLEGCLLDLALPLSRAARAGEGVTQEGVAVDGRLFLGHFRSHLMIFDEPCISRASASTAGAAFEYAQAWHVACYMCRHCLWLAFCFARPCA